VNGSGDFFYIRRYCYLTFEIFVRLAIAGLTTGAIYSLIAIGFTTIYRSSNILNLAQGEFVMLGGLLTIFFIHRFSLSYLAAGILSVLVVTLIGFLIQRLVIKPLMDQSLLILIMATMGLSVFISGSAALVFGTSPKSLPPIIHVEPVLIISTVRINIQSLIIIGVSVLLIFILYLISHHTFYGKAMEAVSTDRLGAELVGIPRDLIMMISFGASAAIGAIAGICITPIIFTQYNSGAILGLKGFSAAVIGGWGRYSGALTGGILLGLIESLSVGIIPSGYKDAVSFTALLLILYFRPKGILGSRALSESRK